jgi:Leucine-rich repeat (LRR) protein
VNLFIGATKIKPIDIAGFNNLDKLRELSLKDLNMMAIPRMFAKMKALTELKLSTSLLIQTRTTSKRYRIWKL